MQSLTMNGYLYLSDEWLGVDQSKEAKKTCVEKDLECMLKILEGSSYRCMWPNTPYT